MTLQVVVLQGAEADLHELRAYLLRRFGASRWRDCKQASARALARIASQPQAGKLPEELLALNLVQYRQVLAGTKRIIYELRGDMAYVHMVCDVHRDLCAVLLRRILETNTDPRDLPPGASHLAREGTPS